MPRRHHLGHANIITENVWVVNAVALLALAATVERMARVSGKSDKNQALPRLGAAIRTAREDAGLSQEAFADGARIDRSHMGKIERGERNLTFLNLLKIAAALELTASALLARAHL